jgi:hypothetical protein
LFTDPIDYAVEFVEPPVLVDQVDYLAEFVDPAPGAGQGQACPPVLQDRVDQVVEFTDAGPTTPVDGTSTGTSRPLPLAPSTNPTRGD